MQATAIGEKPLHSFRNSFSQSILSLKAKQRFGPGHIETATRLAVGLRCIPNDATGKTNLIRDHSSQVADGNFLPGPQIYGLPALVTLGCEHDSFSSIFHIKKFPSRRAVTPKDNLFTADFLCFDTLADECGNDVRTLQIEIVSRAVKIDRKQVNSIESILRAVRLCLHEHHFFC